LKTTNTCTIHFGGGTGISYGNDTDPSSTGDRGDCIVVERYDPNDESRPANVKL
jgi:hypothetical protein